jgi:hypothetical protein
MRLEVERGANAAGMLDNDCSNTIAPTGNLAVELVAIDKPSIRSAAKRCSVPPPRGRPGLLALNSIEIERRARRRSTSFGFVFDVSVVSGNRAALP